MAVPRKLSTLQVSNAVRPLTVEQVRELIFQLGVPLNILDDTAAEHSGQNLKQHFVKKWLDIDVDASWEKLVSALREINMNSLAADIESAHILNHALAAKVGTSLQPANTNDKTPLHIAPSTMSTAPATTQIDTYPAVPTVDQPFEYRVEEVKETIESLEKEFFDIKSGAR